MASTLRVLIIAAAIGFGVAVLSLAAFPGANVICDMEPEACTSGGLYIYGFVVDANSLMPIEGAAVILDGSTAHLTTSTGSYSFNIRVAGTYTVTAGHVGYADQTRTVTMLSEPVRLDFHLGDSYIPPPVVADLDGRVLDGITKQPVVGAKVELREVAGGDVVGWATTDIDGLFTFTLPPGHTWFLTVYAEGREPRTVSVALDRPTSITIYVYPHLPLPLPVILGLVAFAGTYGVLWWRGKRTRG